jgi:hypothetical protein
VAIGEWRRRDSNPKLLSSQDLQNLDTLATSPDSGAKYGGSDGHSQTLPAQVNDTPERQVGAPVVRGIQAETDPDPALAQVIAAWPHLPESIRQKILALARGTDHASTADHLEGGLPGGKTGHF